ncbi:hypothetical protein RCO27_00725 [Sphingosinicella sp. LHD-64]|uniref:hypothetical protein n=1 Tax=Sphingosinicella sp. LHD-64 TaxID=3072139 RepID=UPI002810168C|nr:hypothetical protein [Sphingosinicella sp. LHD-64]MDQ8754740.1 hypothetical protein [Sphingosinicella sp. LHD-64]
MADRRALDAISRIERALARIEVAASRPAPALPLQDSEEHRRLRVAHDRLRQRVTGVIGEIDRMIAKTEPG